MMNRGLSFSTLFHLCALFMMSCISLAAKSLSFVLMPPLSVQPLRTIQTVATATTNLQMASSSDYVSPRMLVSNGMQLFRQGDVQGSLAAFDKADAAVPDGSLKPFLWQRGISYYYLDRFREGSHQFKFDVKVNPLDVEEIVWDIACLARLNSVDSSSNVEFPPSDMMSLPKGKKDRRKIMSTVYALFRGETKEEDLALAGHDLGSTKSDEFYSLFYLGLYCEARGQTEKAEAYMKAAVKTAYATSVGVGDYMTSCAKVHCQLRGWKA